MPVIRAECPRFVCRMCRTKTGWSHQIGCEIGRNTIPECVDCHYWNGKKGRCDHLITRRESANG